MLRRCVGVVATLGLAAVLSGVPGGASVASAAGPPAAPGSRGGGLQSLDILVSPAIDLYFTARTRASGPTRTQSGRGMQRAIAAVQEFEAALGGTSQWGFVDGAVTGCRTAADITASFRLFPESYVYGGRTLPLRKLATDLGQALEAAEAEFLRDTWPGHEKTIEAGIAELRRTLTPKEAAWRGDVLSRLDFAAPTRPAVLYVVAEAPEPWAFTRLDRGRQPVIILGVDGREGTQLAEMAVHEWIHALDADQGANRGAFHELRLKLTAAGIPGAGPEGAPIVHLLMYLQSGETVRRHLDPRHVHFGESYGTYGRMPTSAPALREWWGRYLDGAIGRSEALDSFVREYLEVRSP
jgi:hypothetical protein